MIRQKRRIMSIVCCLLLALLTAAAVSCTADKPNMDDDKVYRYNFTIDDFSPQSNWTEKDNVITFSGKGSSVLKTKEDFTQKQASYSAEVRFGSDGACGIVYRTDEKGDGSTNAFMITDGGSRAGIRMKEHKDAVSYGQEIKAAQGKWHMIKVVLDGSYGEFYVDGKLLFTRSDIAGGDGRIALAAENNVSFRNVRFDNSASENAGWDELLKAAELKRSGWERFNSSKFEYYQCGLGKTNLYVGTDGFTSPESYANRPGDIDQYRFDAMLVYDYWWDGTTRLAPFSISGGYLSGGKVWRGATGTNWEQSLDISSGTVTTKMECAVGNKTVKSTRTVFVKEDGTVCYAITSDTDLPFVFGISPREEGYKVYQYKYDDILSGEYSVSYKSAGDAMTASCYLATDLRNQAYLSVKAVSEKGSVQYDTKAGTVTVNAPKGSTFYIYLSPASDLSPDGDNSLDLVRKAASGYDENRRETDAWWADFWNRGRISIPDEGLSVWYVRSQYYQAAALATARVPAGCFSTNIDGFFGNICFEYDMMFSMTSLQRTGHVNIADDVENWIRRYYDHSCDLAQHSGLFGDVEGASVLCGLMGYDCTPCESWSLRENWHATHGGMNLVSFLFRNAAFKDEDPDFATQVLTSQLKMMDTHFMYDSVNGGYVHTGIWSPTEARFFNMVPGDSLQSESAYWALTKAAELGIPARDPDEIYRRGFHGPNQGSPAFLPYYWQPTRELDDSFYKLLDSVLDGSSFTYFFNRGWCAALCARAGLGDIAEQLVQSMLETDSMLYDDTYMRESAYNETDYKRAPEIGAHGAFVDALSLMLMDAEEEGTIRFFPAIPERYIEQGCAFDLFSAYGGLTVSGSISAEKTQAVIRNGSKTEKSLTVFLRVPAGSASVSRGELADGCFAKFDVTVRGGETVTLEVSGMTSGKVAPKAFRPVFPEDGENGVPMSGASFCWTVSDNVSRYLLRITDITDGSRVIVEQQLDRVNYVKGVRLPYVYEKTGYSWCVYALDSEGTIIGEMEGGPRSFFTGAEKQDDTLFGIKFETIGGAELNDDSITLDIGPNAPYNKNAAFFTPEQQDNFTVTFKISEFRPDTNHQQIGLYIAEANSYWDDAENWGKFMRTYSSRNLIEFYGTSISWSGGGNALDPYEDDSIYMKLELKKGVFTFYISPDGTEWKKLGSGRKTFKNDMILAFSGATFSEADAHAVISEVSVEYE